MKTNETFSSASSLRVIVDARNMFDSFYEVWDGDFLVNRFWGVTEFDHLGKWYRLIIVLAPFRNNYDAFRRERYAADWAYIEPMEANHVR